MKINSLYMPRLLLFAIPFAFISILIILGGAKVEAQGFSYTYTPGPNDVAIAGANSGLQAPESRFRIVSNGNVNVLVEDACVVMNAGAYGMEAVYDGQTKNNISNCSGNDIRFLNVPSDRTLVLRKINGQGHQSYRVTVTIPASSSANPDRTYVTHLNNENRDSPSFTGVDANNGYTTWMGGTKRIKFTAPCDWPMLTNTHIKWKDADWGEYNQQEKPAVELLEYYPGGGRTPKDAIGLDQGDVTSGDGETFAWRTKYGLIPGYQYEWVWYKAQGNNAIFHVMPFSYNPSPNCQNMPDGKIERVFCGSVRGWVVDPNRPNRGVDYRIRINGTAYAWGTANRTINWYPDHDFQAGNGGDNPEMMNTLRAAFGNGTSPVNISLDARDINHDGTEDAGYVNIDSWSGTKACATDQRPTTSIDYADCDVLVVSMDDVNDDGDGMYYSILASPNGAVDTNGDGIPEGSQFLALNSKRVVGQFIVYNPHDNTTNTGWNYSITVTNVKLDGSDDAVVWSNPNTYAQASRSTDVCYRATCSISIQKGHATLPDNGVIAGSSFTANITFTNTGAGRLKSPLGGEGLSATQYPMTSAYPQPNHFASGGWGYNGFPEIPRDNPFTPQAENVVTRAFSFNAPDQVLAGTLRIYPDYYGPGWPPRLGADCTAPVNVFQRYTITAASNITNTLPDPENPNYIQYTSLWTRLTGASPYGGSYYAGTINATAYARLFYRNLGTEDPPNFHERNYAFNASSTALLPESWTDTIPDLRDFNHGGSVDTWKMGDSYCSYFRVDGGDGWWGPAGRLPVSDTADDSCEDVENRPFLRVYSGDVTAGGNFPGFPSTDKGISTYMRGSVSPAGSGVEFAALALDVVKGFSSASMRETTPSAPNGLTFANSSNILTLTQLMSLNSNNTLGGNYASSREGVDWFNEVKEDSTAINNSLNSASLSSPTFENGKQSWGKTTSAAVRFEITNGANFNKRHALFVDGDVVIRNSVVYAGGWTNISDIPSFALIVRGNIYIANTVTQLDGIYVAQPTKDSSGATVANSGRIYTCTDNNGNAFSPASLHANCNAQLKVNGSFVAQDVRFLRTFGTISDVPVTSAASPGVSGTNGFHDVVYTYTWTREAECKNGRKSVALNEPSEPNWGATTDNYLCYKSDYNLKWYHGGPSGTPAAGEECTSFNNPLEHYTHTWHDNYLCAPAGSDIQLQMLFDSNLSDGVGLTAPAGKECIRGDSFLNNNRWEIPWAAAETNGDNTWNHAMLCYKKTDPVASADAVPVKYQKQYFTADGAAESFRAGPDFYLGRPVFRQNGSEYDYITSLPPIL